VAPLNMNQQHMTATFSGAQECIQNDRKIAMVLLVLKMWALTPERHLICYVIRLLDSCYYQNMIFELTRLLSKKFCEWAGKWGRQKLQNIYFLRHII
jgi:hypothetical protein